MNCNKIFGKKNKLIVTASEQRARELYDDYRFFDKNVVYYPAKDVLFYQSDLRGNVLTSERINALKSIKENEYTTLVTTFDALMNTINKEVSMYLLKSEVRQNFERKEVVKNVITNDSKETVKTSKKSTKVGRNDLCPCGSGKKYKQCCGK